MTENEAFKLVDKMVISRKCEIIKTLELKAVILNALEETQQYRAIGTVEEFKDLKEKNEPKKVAYQGEHEKCPICGSFHVFGNYCTECGQKLDLEKENKQ